MRTQHARQFSRRRFLEGLTLAGTAGFLGWHPRPVAAEPPPETATVRLIDQGTCLAPQYLAAVGNRAHDVLGGCGASQPPTAAWLFSGRLGCQGQIGRNTGLGQSGQAGRVAGTGG
jgi:hypothetical protein